MPAIERVFVRHGAYHLDLGRDESGKRRSKLLSRIGDGESAVYAALAKITRPGGRTIAEMLDSFLMAGMKELAPRTQSDYREYVRAQLKPVFGEMAPDSVEPPDIAQYLERRKDKARSGANKEIACLASAYQYGLRNGLCKTNPCRGVRRNKVKAKTRYVRDDEFLLYFDASPDRLQDILAGIYLMELRPGEARELLRTTITPKGVLIEENKTDKMKLVSWSPALQFFLTRATSRVQSDYVFANSKGEKWSETAMHSALATVREALPEGSPRWTFHDIRAKGESDHQGGGHGLLALYKRAKFVTAVR
jgi:site-specific recombinase XerD